MAKQDWSPRKGPRGGGYIIVGMVRRGGGEPQESAWTGTAWSRKRAMTYPTEAGARKAADQIDIRLVDSVAVIPKSWRT